MNAAVEKTKTISNNSKSQLSSPKQLSTFADSTIIQSPKKKYMVPSSVSTPLKKQTSKPLPAGASEHLSRKDVTVSAQQTKENPSTQSTCSLLPKQDPNTYKEEVKSKAHAVYVLTYLYIHKGLMHMYV